MSRNLRDRHDLGMGDPPIGFEWLSLPQTHVVQSGAIIDYLLEEWMRCLNWKLRLIWREPPGPVVGGGLKRATLIEHARPGRVRQLPLARREDVREVARRLVTARDRDDASVNQCLPGSWYFCTASGL
jgi:hypothetical protein